MSQCRHHIDKLKILSLVANLRGEPSPDDYQKDIVELTPSQETFSFSCEGLSMIEADRKASVSTNRKESNATELDCEVATASTVTSPARVAMTDEETQVNSETMECYETKEIQTDSIPNGTRKMSSNDDKPTEKNGNCAHDKLLRSQDSMSSTEGNLLQYSTLKRQKRNSDGCKPPNVLVYSESNVTRANVISTIRKLLHSDRYTIYELNTEQLKTTFWIDNTTLLIVCGPTSSSIGKILMEYYLCGGKLLCLCSDVLNMVLPSYRTAEVRENELVQFSYGKWQKVQLMHHIFCYHPSPIKKHFSLDQDDPQEVEKKKT